MANKTHTEVLGVKEIQETDLTEKELMNLSEGKEILSSNYYTYAELSLDQLHEIAEITGVEYVVEIRPDYVACLSTHESH